MDFINAMIVDVLHQQHTLIGGFSKYCFIVVIVVLKTIKNHYDRLIRNSRTNTY
jgi:hypothetical protein